MTRDAGMRYDALVIDLVTQIERSTNSHKLLTRGEAVLVAVSGGMDSMVLLHLLHHLAAKHDWRFVVAHFNHQLRGSESDGDERFVRRVAKKLKLRCIVEHADVATVARREGMSVEMAARQLRHEFLARTARRLKIRTVALAHHADDQVELFFLRLLRGAGGEGLAGMKWISPSPCDSTVRLVRPLLDQPKSALRSYAEEQGLPFREDSTNTQLDFLRNRIRNKLLPYLTQRYQPALSKTVLRAMDLVGAEADFINEVAEEWLRAKRRPRFGSLHVAVQRRVLQLQLLELGVITGFDLVEQLREKGGHLVTIEPNLAVRRGPDGGVTKEAVLGTDFNKEGITFALSGKSGTTAFGGLAIAWRVFDQRATRKGLPRFVLGREFFDADRVGSSIVLRHWHRGDRFHPIGMTVAVKLQNLFTNQKIARSERHRRVVATTLSGELFWAEGMRMSDQFKLTTATTHRLEWRWRR